MIRVFLVDDQELVRAGFAMVLDAQPDMRVVGEAGDGAAALAVTAADVVLMDVRMPRMDGVEATRQLVAAGSPARVVVLTTFDLDEYAFAALRAGASGFLLKDARPDTVLEAIRTVHRGDAVIAPSTTRRLLARVGPGSRPASYRSRTVRPSALLSWAASSTRSTSRASVAGTGTGPSPRTAAAIPR